MQTKHFGFNSLDVASEFLRLANSNNKTLTSMQINKLVYIAHGFFVGNTGNPLIDEPVQAWQYGPVIKSLYHEFKQFGRSVINPSGYIKNPSHLSADAKGLIKKVYDIYKDYSGLDLSNITHQAGTPWTSAYNGRQNIEIPHDTIEHYYKSLINSHQVAG